MQSLCTCTWLVDYGPARCSQRINVPAHYAGPKPAQPFSPRWKRPRWDLPFKEPFQPGIAQHCGTDFFGRRPARREQGQLRSARTLPADGSAPKPRPIGGQFPDSGGIEAFHCPPSNIVPYWRLQSFPGGGLSFLHLPEVVLAMMKR